MRSKIRSWAAMFSGVRDHVWVRYAILCVMIVAAILAATIISTLTVNMGPVLRRYAEQGAIRWLKRPVEIERLSLHVARGRVLIENLTIAGTRPGDRPFLTAKEISVSLSWSGLLRRRPDVLITSVELVDWEMLVEKWTGGHNFPDFTPDSDGGPRPFTMTLRYLRAWRGQFTYLDHEAPWSVVAPNIDLNIVNAPGYRGEAQFSDGIVVIHDHLPVWVNMQARFAIDGSRLDLERIDLESDGARSVAIGTADMSRWPEMRYDVESRVHFPRMREIFFRNETWNLFGEGDFAGTFALTRGGGYDLSGDFSSPVAGVDRYRFPSLFGSLRWTNEVFEVTDAGSQLYGGASTFGFSITPNTPGTPSTARFDARYDDVDLAQISDLYELSGLRFAGRAAGRNVLDWQLGQFRESRAEGDVIVSPPPGRSMMTPSLAAARAADPEHSRHQWGPFAPIPLPSYLPVAGELRYEWDAERIAFEPSQFVTGSTHVAFQGTTAWGEDSHLVFDVASRDLQESDQVLAGLMTDFGAPTGVVAFGGRGRFEGLMTGPFRRPRIEGTFSGEDLRAWDTLWGDGSARIAVNNGYLTVSDAIVRLDRSELRADGVFSLGYPRQDGGDEIDASFRVSDRDLDGVRHAFRIDGYPVSGALSGEFRLTGRYERPLGFGAMTIDRGTAYGEPFDRGTASLRFDDGGIRLDAVSIVKAGGAITGAAFVGWDGTYSFNANASLIAFETLAAFRYRTATPSGLLEFTAGGSGTFEVPRYDVRFRVNDLAVGEEPVGQVTGTLALRGSELSGELDIASPRLAVSGTGRIALNRRADAELTFRFHNSSLDPYVRLFEPRLSPYTTAVASGSIRVVGELANPDHLLVEATVDTVDMRLFDYEIRNAEAIEMVLDAQVVRIEQMRLVGEDTSLAVSGQVSLRDETIAVRAEGDANLGVLQGFFSDVRGAGRAKLVAGIEGPLYEPVFSGSAMITDGRIRHFSLPNALDAINGEVTFDSSGIRLDEVAATLGGGRLQFGGLIGFDGYLPGELSVSVRGEDIQLRYPEGVRSAVDADLTLRGNFQAPTLGGTVIVRSATWDRRVNPTGGLFDFGGAEAASGGPAAIPVPLRFDVQIQAPSTLRIENNLARLDASADLQLAGTYDRPLLFGRAEVDRGEVSFEGRRYLVTRGAIDFTNPLRIEPFFDVEAETRVRVPGQTYRVTISAAGTADRLGTQFSSDPPLPAADVVALLFSDVRRTQGSADAELRALQNPNQAQTDILTSRATQLLANPLSAGMGRVVEQTFGVDTFQLSPTLIDPYSQSATLSRSFINPSARVTIGKRISERVYLTYSRSVSTSISDQILLLEYDESDRLSWILSRNEDSTYAIEVRVRQTF